MSHFERSFDLCASRVKAIRNSGKSPFAWGVEVSGVRQICGEHRWVSVTGATWPMDIGDEAHIEAR